MCNSGRTSLWNCLRCDFQSPELLDQLETALLSKIEVPIKRFFVSVGACVGSDDQIYTLAANTEIGTIPIVLLHGFGGGIGSWAMNVEAIASNRALYAFDWLGFGRSSRPTFSSDPVEIENQFVDCIERWREAMEVPKMILCGHSFGGWVAAKYALKYPERIEHLILGESWGFTPSRNLRSLRKQLTMKFFKSCSPLSIVRAAGPFGEKMMIASLSDLNGNGNVASFFGDKKLLSRYFYYLNNNKNATGERAFLKLLHRGPWARHPVGETMRSGIKEDIPLTFIYGEQSFMSKAYGQIIKDARPKSYTNIENIPGSHHLNFDNAPEFNRVIVEACKVLKTHN